MKTRSERAFEALCLIALILPMIVLLVLFVGTFLTGAERLDGALLTGFPSRSAATAGLLPALVGTSLLMLLTAVIAIPLGVGAAIWLEEYAAPGRLTRLIELNVANLAGVPSILYGLLGLELFVRVLDLGKSLIAGAATLALLLLPMIVTVSREALRTVPPGLREAGLALGAERGRVLFQVVLPQAAPGILSGVILALARAIGETAPLVVMGALTYVAFLPDGLSSPFTALPIQIFNWVSRPQPAFQITAAAGIIVLIALMVIMNAAAVALRRRLERHVPR
jgi:phosphate transport system permease protein